MYDCFPALTETLISRRCSTVCATVGDIIECLLSNGRDMIVSIRRTAKLFKQHPHHGLLM